MGLAVCGALALTWLACQKDADRPSRAVRTATAWPPLEPEELLQQASDEIKECAECHAQIVRDWLQNGMSDTLGPITDDFGDYVLAEENWHTQPRSQTHYRVQSNSTQSEASTSEADWQIIQQKEAGSGWPAAQRTQALQYRIGAGVHAISLVGREGARWFFAPLEFFFNSGWHLAVTELGNSPSGLERPVTFECLACHTEQPLPRPYPLHHLEDLEPRGISCSGCHGSGQNHIKKMREWKLDDTLREKDADTAILNPAGLPAARQLDICARCHLQGDARIELHSAEDPFAPGEDLLSKRAVFVAADPGADFGFVSQVNRLTLSACFVESPEMTCSTCHDPHVAGRKTNPNHYLQACMDCHPRPHTKVAVNEGTENCISCHMRRSQPFDLGHVEITDHWIQKRPAPSHQRIAERQQETMNGKVQQYFYRPEQALQFSSRERDLLQALALVQVGDLQTAGRLMQRLPVPGTSAARRPEENEGPYPVVQVPMLHFTRGRLLYMQKDLTAAEAAYRDALILNNRFPEASVNLAWILIEQKRYEEARDIAVRLRQEHPHAEVPWNILAVLEQQQNRDLQAAAQAFSESLERNPNQTAVWNSLGQIYRSIGKPTEARKAFEKAYTLDPYRQDIRSALAALGSQ